MKIETTAPQTLTPPLPGQLWLGQGGIYAGIVHNTENGQRWHLIVHPELQGKATWGEEGKETKAVSKADGAANTQNLLPDGPHHAANLAAGAFIDGHADYYLPAQREALLMAATLGETLGTAWHWTSTQYSANDAWCQAFENGYRRINLKGYKLAVRAVRRILII